MKPTIAFTPILMLLLIVCSCNKQAQKEATSTPNIILIMSDDLGWYDTGFNGNSEVKTPNMDALAAQGVIFDRFYSASAVCSPTRASLITGRNPLRMNIPYANSGHMKTAEVTIPEILKENGYTTGHFGKWHLGTLTKNVLDANRGGKEKFVEDYSIPTQHGYDEYFSTESKVPTYDPMLYPRTFATGESKRYGWRAVGATDSTVNYGTAYWTGEGQQTTENLHGDDSRIIMDRAIPFIEKATEQNKPFFSTIWLHTPHLPVVSDSVHRTYYKEMSLQKQLYYGSITAMDEQIGRLWHKLEELGISENTVLFFCSDNGPERGTPGSAGEFRERKRSLYEGGIRVPAFAVWKNQFNEGERIDFPAVTSDYLPTLLEILNIQYPDARPIDGVSILGVLKGANIERAKPIGFICNPHTSWVNNQYKLIKHGNDDIFELYDLLNDKSETNNIIEEYPEIAKQMETELSNWLHSVETSESGIDYTK